MEFEKQTHARNVTVLHLHHNSTRVDERKELLIMLLAIKMKARTVVAGRGEECPLCVPGTDIRKEGSGRSKACIVNGMEAKTTKLTANAFMFVYIVALARRCLLIGTNGAGKSTLLRVLAGRHLTCLLYTSPSPRD